MTSSSSSESIGVGVIGVGSPQSWAREAHVTAVRAVPGLELVAIATRDSDTAQATADELGARTGYGDAERLINDPDVAVVTIGAPVPAHHDLVLAALRAGKHVVTEWPVGTNTAQTAELAAAAAFSRLHAAVDLQARMSPAIARARQLVCSGALGRVLSVTVYSSTAAFGPTTTKSGLYLEDPTSGMNLTTIQTAHTLDAAVYVAGPLRSLSAQRTVRFPDVQVSDADREGPRVVARTEPDHLLITGRLADGGALAIQVIGGRPAEDTPFRLDVEGEKGSLAVTGGGPRGFQASRLTLHDNDQPVEEHDELPADVPDAVVNVAHIYAALQHDLTTNATTTTPNFDDAVRLSHLIDDLIKADDQQKVITATAHWPRAR